MELVNIAGRLVHAFMLDGDSAGRRAGGNLNAAFGRKFDPDVSGTGAEMPIVMRNSLDMESAAVGCGLDATARSQHFDSAGSLFDHRLGASILAQTDIAFARLGFHFKHPIGHYIAFARDGLHQSMDNEIHFDIARSGLQLGRPGNPDQLLVPSAHYGGVDLRPIWDIDSVKNVRSRAGGGSLGSIVDRDVASVLLNEHAGLR